MSVREQAALGALGGILGITVAWWALALWPLEAESAAWLSQTRAVCFGMGSNGLPDAGGWLLLLGEPPVMLATLLVIGGNALRDGLRRLSRSSGGVPMLIGASVLVLAAGGGAGARIARLVSAARASEPRLIPAERLDRAAPTLALMDQRGDSVTLEGLRGRPVVVILAYAHCETVCPLTVREAIAARRAAASDPALLVISLDPWRDRPERLGSIARQWGLDRPGEHVLSGTVDDVRATLDRWQVVRARDSLSGEVTHVPVAYLVNPHGRLVYRSAGRIDVLTRLASSR